MGFLIWFTVPTVLASSSIYAVGKLRAANKARKIFITAFFVAVLDPTLKRLLKTLKAMPTERKRSMVRF